MFSKAERMQTADAHGNNAVHPGELDLKDDRATAVKLFDLINMIADNQITQPNAVKKMFEEKIPDGAKDKIARRDDPKN